jgi:hypothetical protein
MHRSLVILAMTAIASSPAAAHPGDHVHMSIGEMIAHYAEADHLAFLALTVIVGWLAYRAGRRTEARIQAKARSPEDRS